MAQTHRGKGITRFGTSLLKNGSGLMGRWERGMEGRYLLFNALRGKGSLTLLLKGRPPSSCLCEKVTLEFFLETKLIFFLGWDPPFLVGGIFRGFFGPEGVSYLKEDSLIL